MKKIISIFLIIIFMFNFTGCATVENRTEKVSNNSKTINKANEKTGYSIKNDGDRTRAGLLGAAICGLLLGGGIAIYGISTAESKGGKGLFIVFAIVEGTVGMIGGFLLGECIYDNLSEK